MFFLIAVVCFIVSIFVNSHASDWVAAGLAALAAGHLLEGWSALPSFIAPRRKTTQ